MNWSGKDEIDWEMVTQFLRQKLSRLFAEAPHPEPEFSLIFWIDTNGGLNFDVYQALPDDTQIRFGDIVPWWNEDMDSMDRAFATVVDQLAEQDDYDSVDEIDEKLREIVKAKCQELEAENFGYPPECRVTWEMQS